MLGRRPDDDRLERLQATGQDPLDDHLEEQAGYQPPRLRRSAPTRPCTCGARETGWKHPGHLYTCPRHARIDERRDAA